MNFHPWGYAAATFLAFFGALIVPQSALGADLPQPTVTADDLRQIVTRDAELYLLRATFDVVETQQIPEMLAEDAHHFISDSKANLERDAADLNEKLLAEGSYYATNLYYLISVDGAVWPSDRSEADYKGESLRELEDIRHQWIASVHSDAELGPLLRRLDIVNALTHGETSLNPDLDHFATTSDLVEETMESLEGKA